MKRLLSVLLAALLLVGTVPTHAAPERWVDDAAHDGLTVFVDTYEDGSCLGGYLNEAGEEVIPAIYSSVMPFEGGYAQVARDEPGTGYALWGVIDTTGREVVPCHYCSVYWSERRSDGLVMVEGWNHHYYDMVENRDHRYGMVDTASGEEAYACVYPDRDTLEYAISQGVDDPTLLWKSQVDGVAESGLSVTWYPQYRTITRFYGTGRMLVRGQNDHYALFSLDGRQLTDFGYTAIGEPVNGRFPACRVGKWGALDEQGYVVTDFCYDTADEARYDVGVSFVGRWPDQPPYALARWDGTRLTGYDFWTYQPFVNGFALVTDGERWGYLNTAGKLITPMQYDGESGNFDENGVAITYQYMNRYNLIDATGKELLPHTSIYRPWYAGRGLYGYVEDGKMGFIDRTGQVVIPPREEYQTGIKGERLGGTFSEEGADQMFYEGLCLVNGEGNSMGWGRDFMGPWGFMDTDEKLVVPTLFDGVEQFEEGYALVKLGEVYGLLKNPLQAGACSDWAEEELARATDQGLVTADCAHYRTYSITRAQFAHLAVNYLEKALGQPITPAPADTFTDTTDEGILKAYAAGIVQGVGEGRFSPGGLLTREQLATMLWRAMERAGAGMYIGGINKYSDWGQVSDWAKDAMNCLICHEVMQGTSATTLSPQDSCTVEQAILLIARAAEKDYPTPTEQDAQLRAARDRMTIQGLAIGTPLDQLPEELRSTLSPVGQPYDGWATEPGKEIAQHYEAPGITIITSRATEEVLRRMVENNGEDYLTEEFGTTDRVAILERELGREYVEKVILTSDAYALVSGLKVGDSEEQARALGHTYLDADTVGFYGSTEITWEDGVVTQIQVWDDIGRRVGPFFDP